MITVQARCSCSDGYFNINSNEEIKQTLLSDLEAIEEIRCLDNNQVLDKFTIHYPENIEPRRTFTDLDFEIILFEKKISTNDYRRKSSTSRFIVCNFACLFIIA